jgi:hypothetical protein
MEIQFVDAEGYRPGACNIGPAELAKRRQAAVGATIALVVIAAAVVTLGLPGIARWGLLPVAVGTAATWEQALRRFCVAFGAAGIRNFGALGGATKVVDREAARADRRQALRMLGESVVIGSAITLAFVLLPV